LAGIESHYQDLSWIAALKRLATARFRPWPPCFQTLTRHRKRGVIPFHSRTFGSSDLPPWNEAEFWAQFQAGPVYSALPFLSSPQNRSADVITVRAVSIVITPESFSMAEASSRPPYTFVRHRHCGLAASTARLLSELLLRSHSWPVYLVRSNRQGLRSKNLMGF
jgi:hypothetical protein